MKIGIFGGTFDPPHMGHIAIVDSAIKQLSLDKVIVFPCGTPPHKVTDTSKHHRLEMTKLSFADMPIEIDDFEMDKGGQSYTIDTVRYVMSLYPDSSITLIVGGDSYAQLSSWYCYTQLLELVDVAVAVRSGFQLLDYGYQCNTHVMQFDNIDISSTDIRVRCQFGLDVSSMVSPSVVQYIADNKLYSNYRAMTSVLQDMVKPRRYMHTYNVVVTALNISGGRQYDSVFVASALHDCAKSCVSQYQHIASDSDIAHAHIGAVVAREKFGIGDQQILDAIYYHTTGRANMSWLEKVVYLADKLEPTRNYDTQQLYRDTLDETLLATMTDLVQFLHEIGKQPHALTEEALVYYNNKINKEEGKL